MSNSLTLAIQSAGEPVALQGRRVFALVSSVVEETDQQETVIQRTKYTFHVDCDDIPENLEIIEYKGMKLQFIGETDDKSGVIALDAVE